MDSRKEKGSYTNEKLSKKFINQFDLVNYAIRLAENMIRTGRDARVKTEFQNRSMQILAEIVEDKDFFDEIIDSPILSEDLQSHATGSIEENNNFSTEKFSEKRKARKILSE